MSTELKIGTSWTLLGIGPLTITIQGGGLGSFKAIDQNSEVTIVPEFSLGRSSYEKSRDIDYAGVEVYGRATGYEFITVTVSALGAGPETPTPTGGIIYIPVEGPQGPPGADGADGADGSAETMVFKDINETTYTLLEADLGKILRFTSDLAVTVTGPNDLPVGFNCTLRQIGDGQVAFEADAGASINTVIIPTVTLQKHANVAIAVEANADNSSAEYMVV